MIRQRAWLLICVLHRRRSGIRAWRRFVDRAISSSPSASLMPAPAWALAERRLLALNAEGVALWASKYLDANGYLRGAANFGIEDGPGRCGREHPQLAAGACARRTGVDHRVVGRAWEGHLDQYTKAKDPSTELAKDGMYYKEFPTVLRLGAHRRRPRAVLLVRPEPADR